MKRITLGWLLFFTGLAGSPTAAPPPNVLILLADQWRASATDYAGDPNVKTPHLDRLAKQALRFDNAVSVCPVCTPYRAALMTGRYPTRTGMFMNDLYLPDEALCLAEIYQAAGYETGYIGKWHLDGHGRSAFIPPARRQGFEYWKGAECDHTYNRSHYYAGDSPEKRFWEGYDAFAQTQDARQFIRDHAGKEKPFLLLVAYGTPHFPHQTAPQAFRDLYPPESLTLPPNVPASMQKAARQELNGYYAHCTALDQCVGDLVRALDESGVADRTILLFTSDHGEMMGAQGVAPKTKQVPWDESVHVPLLLRYPAVLGRDARVIDTPINAPDLLPTLLGLSGMTIPKMIEGEDLSGSLRDDGKGRDRAALIMSVAPFTSAAKEYRGIRTRRYTYVRNLAGPWLLYDNLADAHQQHNLANDPAQAALQKELDTRLQAELKRIGDDFRPKQFYLDKWGYQVDRGGAIPYDDQAPMQRPKREVFRDELPPGLGK